MNDFPGNARHGRLQVLRDAVGQHEAYRGHHLCFREQRRQDRQEQCYHEG